MLKAQDIKNYLERADYRPVGYLALRQALSPRVEEYGNFARVLGKLLKTGEVYRDPHKHYRLAEPEEIIPLTRRPINSYQSLTNPPLPTDRRQDWAVVIKRHNLRDHFPSDAWTEAENIAPQVQEEERSGRRDLRGLQMVTIDGSDAKDLDDAVSILTLPSGNFSVGVHIADVSHYVKPGSPLDQEARERGTSVYLLDRVLPMLPPRLSNGICSLNAGVERLALSCLMEVDRHGQLTAYEIVKSVINIDRRLSYEQVNHLLENPGAPEPRENLRPLDEDLIKLQAVAQQFRRQRLQRGMLDFDFPETKIVVDEKGFPIEVRRAERGPGEMLIEDLMIKANETVAAHLRKLDLPLLYRVHERPDGEGLERLNRVLKVFGHRLHSNEPSAKACQHILERIHGQPEEQTISLMLLRSMQHARYSPQPLGHFGLAADNYCHFTSPIRRYPDLFVHRVLSAWLEGSMNGVQRQKLGARLSVLGEHCTDQEIRAEEAERELRDLKKAQYLHQFLGEEFDARISSVLSFGFFVTLENTVEGLVHVSSLRHDYYLFDERSFSLRGQRNGHTFRIGDPVRVRLIRVDEERGEIDFQWLPPSRRQPKLENPEKP